jgi:intracellular sulfur oxidation DsrE/DsrF family protein
MPAWGGSDVTASNHTDSSPPRADVVVVGGGAVGLAVAWRAAGRGLEVVVCEASMAGSATPAAAGLLAPVTEVQFGEEELLRLNLESAGLFPAFVRELEETSGLDPGYRTTGTIVVARDSDDNALLEELFRYQARLGLDVTRLKSPDCRRLEPALVPSVRGGILVEGDHQVDPRLLLEALREACRRAGVRFDPFVGLVQVCRTGDLLHQMLRQGSLLIPRRGRLRLRGRTSSGSAFAGCAVAQRRLQGLVEEVLLVGAALLSLHAHRKGQSAPCCGIRPFTP